MQSSSSDVTSIPAARWRTTAWVDGYYVDTSGRWCHDVWGYRSGIYVVGGDAPAGEYKLVADNAGSINKREPWSSGSFEVDESELDSKTMFYNYCFERGLGRTTGLVTGARLCTNSRTVKPSRRRAPRSSPWPITPRS